MRRSRDPTLYTHDEQVEEEGEHPTNSGHWSRAPPHTHSYTSTSRYGLPKSQSSYNGSSSNGSPHNAAQSGSTLSTAVYSQFISRFKREAANEEASRVDPDVHYFHRGLGQLMDGGNDSDDDQNSDFEDVAATATLDADPESADADKRRERLEWHSMLQSVMDGDVLKSEKHRVLVMMDHTEQTRHARHLALWIGLRARLTGRKEDAERKLIEERRIRIVDPLITEILEFHVEQIDAPNGNGVQVEHDPLPVVQNILLRWEGAVSLYPTTHALRAEKPACAQPDFDTRLNALTTWWNLSTMLSHQIVTLQKWTGSDSLDVNAPAPLRERPIFPRAAGANGRSQDESSDGNTFVERFLKEDTLQERFEKGALQTIHTFIGSARLAMLEHADASDAMGLPRFDQQLGQLSSFPPRLVQASLRVRIKYAQMRDPDILAIDQLTEDLKIALALACTLKREYEALTAPDAEGFWNLPPCIADDYDADVLEALRCLFKLIYLKLKSGEKSIYFKETDIIESHWPIFQIVSMTVDDGSVSVAEQLLGLTNKLLFRVVDYFENQIQVPKSKRMTGEETVSWFHKVLEGVRLRHRKLLRFTRTLNQLCMNSAEYSLELVELDAFMSILVDTDHILVYTQTFELDGTYIIIDPSLKDRPDLVKQMLTRAYSMADVPKSEGNILDDEASDGDSPEDPYILILTPCQRFLWQGAVLLLEIPKIDLELRDKRMRIVANGTHSKLARAKQVFISALEEEDGDPNGDFSYGQLSISTQQMSLFPAVTREMRKVFKSSVRLAEAVIHSIHDVRQALHSVPNSQEPQQLWFAFASDQGLSAQRHMDAPAYRKFSVLLTRLAISWLNFITDDCNPNDRRTFRWAVQVLEFTTHRTRRGNVLLIGAADFAMLRQKVASCMTLLISHFDILGARSNVEAKKEQERVDEIQRQRVERAVSASDAVDYQAWVNGVDASWTSYYADHSTPLDHSLRRYREKLVPALAEIDERREAIELEQHTVGRVLDGEKPEDRSLQFLASSASSVQIKWQQGRFIGSGAFGQVYIAVNLDTGGLMAAKEIRFQDTSNLTHLKAVRDELAVMQMLHHPNIVEFYGIEVHRDKVFIFEEYCAGGSLASVLTSGRIEDEVAQLYTLQILEGLHYLHAENVVHRDIKPDNIMLDAAGFVKLVDFGAAKMLARNHKTMVRTRVATMAGVPGKTSLTGTPMYMSPEVIKNEKRGRHGAMDIWSLGCVVLECATGKKPWSNLDNEWAIMFHIGVATQHPPLPDPGTFSDLGINFIKQCLTIDPVKRPTSVELLDHPWLLACRDMIQRYEESHPVNDEEAALANAAEEEYNGATMAGPSALFHEREAARLREPSPPSSDLSTSIDSISIS